MVVAAWRPSALGGQHGRPHLQAHTGDPWRGCVPSWGKAKKQPAGPATVSPGRHSSSVGSVPNTFRPIHRGAAVLTPRSCRQHRPRPYRHHRHRTPGRRLAGPNLAPYRPPAACTWRGSSRPTCRFDLPCEGPQPCTEAGTHRGSQAVGYGREPIAEKPQATFGSPGAM